jgi:predicted metal-dependent hydrolase
MRAIEYPPAYIDYLAEYYGSRDYFECHEIMEEFWKENEWPEYRTCWLVLIRIAVCQYHSRRGNWTGAIKLMGKAADEAEPELFDRLGIDGGELAELLRRTAREWGEPDASYRDIDLPIRDERLLGAAKQRCLELGYTWNLPGLEAGEEVIHRHLTRDREEVVLARAESARLKALSRGIREPDTRP